MSAHPRVSIVSEDGAARRSLTAAFLDAGWQSDADQFPTLTAAIEYLQEMSKDGSWDGSQVGSQDGSRDWSKESSRDGSAADSAPAVLVIDYVSRSDDIRHAIAAIRRCDAGAALPIVVLTTALQNEAPPVQLFTFGVLRVHLSSYGLPSLVAMARALRRILAGRGDLFRRSTWIRDEDLPRLAILVGDIR